MRYANHLTSAANRRDLSNRRPKRLGAWTLWTIALLLAPAAPTAVQARDRVPAPNSPFAIVPAHLKTLSTSEQAPIRPLLIFQMGSAGSFQYPDSVTIDGVLLTTSRWDIAKKLLLKYTKKYRNSIQWAWYKDTDALNKPTHVMNCREPGFWDRNKKASCGNAVMDNMLAWYKDRYGGDQWNLRRWSNVRLQNWYLEHGSFRSGNEWGVYEKFRHAIETTSTKNGDFRPLSLNYVVNPVISLRYNIRYRCQPAFYVVVDDGYQQMYGNDRMNSNSENAIYGMFELAREGLNPYDWKKIKIQPFADLHGSHGRLRAPSTIMSYDYACMTKFGGTSDGSWFTAQEPTDGSCGMRFFSHTLATTDLMKEGSLPSGRETDDAGESWDDPAFPRQSIKTFTIRINTDNHKTFGPYAYATNANQSYFRMKGIASQDDYFFNVTNGDQLKNAFDSIIQTVEKSIQYAKVESFSTISPALGAQATSPVPNSAANVRLNMFSGSSEIRFHKVTSNYDKDKFKKADDDKAEYDLSATYDIKVDMKTHTLPLFSERTPIFGEGNKAYKKSDLQNRFTLSDFDIPKTSGTWPFQNEWNDSLLSWLTRTRPDQEIKDDNRNNLNYRVRNITKDFDNYHMGDIIDTPVLDMGDFLAAAANDGMVYIFKMLKDSDPKKDGRFSLKVNYVPMDVVREDAQDLMRKHYKFLVHPEYAQSPDKPHQYMINGGLTWRLTAPAPEKESRNLVVAGTYGQGGRGAYVLTIAGNDFRDGSRIDVGQDVGTWKDKILTFNVNANDRDYNKLGYTFGDPQIGTVASSRTTTLVTDPNDPNKKKFRTEFPTDEYYYVMFLSSGFNNPEKGVADTESALYLINMFDTRFGINFIKKENDKGKLLKKVVADEHGGGLAQSTLVDIDNDGIVDVGYAGDYNGSLYRFDFKNGVASATAQKIFSAPQGQHFTSAPAVYKVKKKSPKTKAMEETGEIMVVIGTGSDIYQQDAEDKSRNSVYGIRDDLTVIQPSTYDIRDLQEQTIKDGGVYLDRRGIEVQTRVGSDHKNLEKKGWYVNLSSGTGERVTTKPIIFDGMAVITTRMYDSKTTSSSSGSNNGKKDPCKKTTSSQQFSGKGWVMQFDAATGSIPKDFDLKTDLYEAAYVDFLGHLDKDKGGNKPIVSGVMEEGAGLPSLTLSGGKPVVERLQIFKGEEIDKNLQMDADFEGDIGGPGVSGDIPKLSELKEKTERNYNNALMKYDREKIVPALFISTSVKGLQDPFAIAVKYIPPAPAPVPPAGQTQILKRISFKVLD